MFLIPSQIFKALTKTERQIFLGALAVFLVSLTTWSILTLENATTTVPAESNDYREGLLGQPIAINPVISGTNDVDRDLIELLFTDLLSLAENYKTSNNGQTWNITLKSNLRWSDGKPLTSDDVIFTIEAIQNSDSRSPLFLTWQGVIINRISEREVEFTLRNPYAFFLDNLRDLKIIPRHIFQNLPVENFRLSDYNLEPVGNGPYAYVSFEKRKGGFITDYHLKTNQYYSGPKPFLRNLDLKFYSESGQIIDAFNTKKIDGFGSLNPKKLDSIKLSNQIIEKAMPRYYAIFLNKNIKVSLGSETVISALNLATNKERIIKEVFNGKAAIINEPILPILEGYDPSADPGHEFSLEKARALLEKDKWLLNPETGIREKKTGKQNETLEFSLVVPQISFLTETADILKEDWGKIGTKLNLIILNPADIVNEVIKTRNYQMIIFGNVLRNNPDIFSFWHSSERFYPGLNLALYANKKVDALLESARKNSDEASRNKDLSEIQKIISKDKPAIFLYSPIYLYVAPKEFGGFEEKIITVPSDRFRDINKWYSKTNRVLK